MKIIFTDGTHTWFHGVTFAEARRYVRAYFPRLRIARIES